MRPNWFIAIPIAAGSWFEALIEDIPSGLRIFHPEDLHLTVAFLGGCDESDARNAWTRLDALLHAPIHAALGEVKPMGHPRRPSAFSVTLTTGEAQTAALMGTLRSVAFEAAGGIGGSRPPLPHITVARPPRRAKAPLRQAGVRWAERCEAVGVSVTLDRLALYTWSADRRQRLFTIVEERQLHRSP